MYICKHCGKSEVSVSTHANHSRWCNYNPTNANKRGKTLECIRCKIGFCLLSHKDRSTTCSAECRNRRTEKEKTVISKGRKKFLSENPDKHHWKSKNKNKSVPCEKAKQYLHDLGIEFIEEYQPLKDRFFSIDIAFPNIKIGVEINGNQHYNADGTLSKYYQERHDILESAGWKIIEAHYSMCFNKDDLSRIFNFEIPFSSNEEIIKLKKLIQSNKKKKVAPPLARGLKIKNKTDAKWEPIKNEIFNHNIDFSKYGWATKVSNVLGIPSQKVNWWMKRYHTAFFETYCFKRKGQT